MCTTYKFMNLHITLTLSFLKILKTFNFIRNGIVVCYTSDKNLICVFLTLWRERRTPNWPFHVCPRLISDRMNITPFTLSSPFRFSNKDTSYRSHACYMFRPPHIIWFDRPRWIVKIVEYPITQFCPPFFFALIYENCPLHPVLKRPHCAEIIIPISSSPSEVQIYFPALYCKTSQKKKTSHVPPSG